MKLRGAACLAAAVLPGLVHSILPGQTPLQLSVQSLGIIHTDSTVLKETPVVKLHRQLIQIDSVTGNEKEVGEFLISELRSLGFSVDKQDIKTSSYPKPRFNIHAYHGTNRETRSLLTSHIDTVPPFFNYSVRTPEAGAASKSLEIWGRGSNDDKSCVSAQITALHSLLSDGKVKPSDASLLFVVGEEAGGDGMHAANDLGLKWEAVIFGEPTESKLAGGHKGFLLFEIVAQGQAVHSGYPWLGRSANDIIVAALAGLQRLGALNESEGGLPQSERFGKSTINIGKIQGGVAANVVAERASALVAIRLAAGTPDDSKKIVVDMIKHSVADLVEDGKGSVSIKFTGKSYSPVLCDTDIEGFEKTTVNYGTDVPNLKGQHKRYLYGPGTILSAHSDHEHLTVDELEQSVEDYKKILLAVLER